MNAACRNSTDKPTHFECLVYDKAGTLEPFFQLIILGQFDMRLKTMNYGTYLTPYTKINFRLIVDLNVEGKIIL